MPKIKHGPDCDAALWEGREEGWQACRDDLVKKMYKMREEIRPNNVAAAFLLKCGDAAISMIDNHQFSSHSWDFPDEEEKD